MCSLSLHPYADTELTPVLARSNKENLVALNLNRLQHWIDRGLIDPSMPITMKELKDTRCIHGIKDGVKLLGDVRSTSLSLFSTLADRPVPCRAPNT